MATYQFGDFPGQLDTNRRNSDHIIITKAENGYSFYINGSHYVAYGLDGVIKKIEEVLSDRERV